MKYVYQPYNILVSSPEGGIITLCIENPAIFCKVIDDLYCQCTGQDGIGVVSEDDKILDIGKCADIIVSPFDLDFNNRKMKLRLFEMLKEITNDLYYESFLALQNEFARLMELIVSEVTYPLEYKDVNDLLDILKLGEIHFNFEGCSIAERLDNYLKLESTLMKKKVVFLVDVRKYLEDAEWTEICKTAAYYKLNLILIESQYRKLDEIGKTIVIDSDQCIIEL